MTKDRSEASPIYTHNLFNLASELSYKPEESTHSTEQMYKRKLEDMEKRIVSLDQSINEAESMRPSRMGMHSIDMVSDNMANSVAVEQAAQLESRVNELTNRVEKLSGILGKQTQKSEVIKRIKADHSLER